MVDRDAGWRTRWLELVSTWQSRLSDAGLGDLTRAFSEILRPLGPVAAQLLWIVQPAFGLFGYSRAVAALADLLDDPDTGRAT